jgi:nucleotide-binding universal stress UspA family protein
MKNILIPTDFSDHAKNAGFYAVEVAKITKSHLSILHTFNLAASKLYPPVYSGTMPSELERKELTQQIEKENELCLKTFKETILKGQNEPVTSMAQSTGFVSESVNNFAEKKNIDLIVMGTKGKSKRPDASLAPITFDVINSGVVPVLAIHENIKYTPIKKIALAVNKSFDKGGLSFLEVLVDFSKKFKAELFILFCSKTDDADKSNLFLNSISKEAEHLLSGVKWHLVNIKNNNNEEKLATKIDAFITENDINLISLITRKQDLFQKIYQSSKIKLHKFHTDIPLLAIPGI